MINFINIEIKKPRSPRARIPSAEILAVDSNSFRVGFFNTCQTLLHLIKNDFAGVIIFIKKVCMGGF